MVRGNRRAVHGRRFRAQAVRAAAETAYYADLFSRLGLDPSRLRYEDIQRIPPTTKEALREDPDAFVSRKAAPSFWTTTTGTTGRPTCISFSEREMRTYIALEAITFLHNGEVQSDDIEQISTSSRAALGNTCFAGGCARAGAMVSVGGLIEPRQALAMLAQERRVPGKKPRTSVLSIYPSYLGELVEHGLRHGYRPGDFGLERIFVGGEIVTEGLKRRARRLFGPVALGEGYGTTETWPLAPMVCSQGHMHYEPSQALVEVVNHETGLAADAGETGTMVATPLPPYRETTILLRYDTQDVVRVLLPTAVTCELAHMPATGKILGQLRLAVHPDRGWTYPRDVLEAVEGLEEVPLPARCGTWAAPGGVAVEVVVRRNAPEAARTIRASLEQRGVPVREMHLAEDPRQLRHPWPLRCDLKELLFADPGASPPPPHQDGAAGTASAGGQS